jgi:hypothetical protein
MQTNTAGVLIDDRAVCLDCFKTTPDRERLWKENRIRTLSSLQGWSPRRRRECACGARFLGRVI